LPDRAAVQAAYALDASAEELTWISGPPLALGIGVLWSTGAALAAGGCVLLLGTVMFAAQPASRGWKATEVVARRRGGSMRAPAMRNLVIVLIAVGTLFGAVEVAITGAAQGAGTSGLAAPLIALWGAGSLAGGLVLARRPSRTNSSRDLVLLLAALTLGHASLTAATTSIYALGVLLFVAGAAIAPTFTTVYAIVDRVTPAGTMTESFAWLETAIAMGGAIGAAVAGSLVDAAGPGAVFAFAGGAGALALLITAARMRTLRPAGVSLSPTLSAVPLSAIPIDATS
jgi:predicted MFS family arabinose efflux permease